MASWLFKISLLSLFLAPLALADSVTVIATEGGIRLEGSEEALSDDQREAFLKWLDGQLQDSSFVLFGGRVTLRLGEDKLRELRPALDALIQGDDSAIDSLFDSMVDTPEDGGSERTVIGDRFRVEAGEALDRIVAIGSRGVIEGRVKTLVLLGSTVVVTRTGEVTDKLIAVGSEVVRQPGSTVSSEEINIYLPGSGDFWEGIASQWRENQFWNDARYFSQAIGTLILGILYLLLFPAFARYNRNLLEERWGMSLLYGLIASLAVIPGVIVLVLTVFGILLVPFYVIGAMLLWILGHVEVATCVGARLLGKRSPHLIVSFLAGFALFQFVDWIPWVGGLVVGLATLSGVGAFVVGLFRQWKPV